MVTSQSPVIRHMDSQEARPARWNQPCLGLLLPDWDERADRASTLTYTGTSHSQARRTDDGTGLQSHCQWLGGPAMPLDDSANLPKHAPNAWSEQGRTFSLFALPQRRLRHGWQRQSSPSPPTPTAPLVGLSSDL